jgi:hypothetical protein
MSWISMPRKLSVIPFFNFFSFKLNGYTLIQLELFQLAKKLFICSATQRTKNGSPHQQSCVDVHVHIK